jgi:hypothetical protein
MRDDKKGISTIIVSLILIVIVLGAVAIVWFIVKDLVGGSAEKINLGSKCLDVDLKATKLLCTGTNKDTCDVTLERGPGGEAIGGAKLVFTNSTNDRNFVHDVTGDISVLGTKAVSAVATNITNANKVEVTVYFKDESDKEELCSGSSSFSP